MEMTGTCLATLVGDETSCTIIVAWNDMGDVYQMKGNKEEAIKCYKQALKINPDNQRAKENLEKLPY